MIRAAIMRTGLSDWNNIEAAILKGDMLLWLAWDGQRIEAAAATSLERANGNLVCVVVACGGESMGRWIDLIHGIEDYAKQEGCTCTRIIGRKGWLRALDSYRAQYVIMEKAL